MKATLQALLQRLATAAPDVCRRISPDHNIWNIGGRNINIDFDHAAPGEYIYDKDLALDWLAGAVMRAAAARGWDYSHATQGGYHFVTVWNSALESGFDSPNDSQHIAAALLSAFVEAVEAVSDPAAR